MFSDDGIAWTTAGSPTDEWSSVTYGGGLFVAVAGLSPTGVMTSPDGQTWTSRTAPLGDWYGVTYGDGVFVAVGSPSLGPDVVMISYTPTLTSVSPTSGPLTGNTSVTLTGTHLTGATGVTFGGVTAPFTVVSDTQITATSPMHAAGPAAVLVTLPGGSVAGVYTFADAPPPPGPPPAPPAPAPAPSSTPSVVPVVPVPSPSPTAALALHQESLTVSFAAGSSRVNAAATKRIRVFLAEQPGPIVGTRIIGFPAGSGKAAKARADATAAAVKGSGVTVSRSPGRLNGHGDTATFPRRAGTVYLTVWSVS